MNLPNPWISAPIAETAVAASNPPPVPEAAAATHSPGAIDGSLPAGEIEPSVTPACSPGESRFIPDYDAMFDAMCPPEPPPLFLRSPSQAFVRALFHLSGMNT